MIKVEKCATRCCSDEARERSRGAGPGGEVGAGRRAWRTCHSAHLERPQPRATRHAPKTLGTVPGERPNSGYDAPRVR